MLILFDHGAPRGVARVLRSHTVVTALERGWDRLTNGALLKAAEEAAVDLLFTTGQRMRYQQNLTGRKIAIVVLTARRNGHAYNCTWNASPPWWTRPRPAATPKFRSLSTDLLAVAAVGHNPETPPKMV